MLLENEKLIVVRNKESMSVLKIVHYFLLQYMNKTIHPVAGATAKGNFVRSVNCVCIFGWYVDLHILCLQLRHKIFKSDPRNITRQERILTSTASVYKRVWVCMYLSMHLSIPYVMHTEYFKSVMKKKPEFLER